MRAFATVRHEIEIPIYRMLATPLDELRERATQMIAATSCRVIDSACALGGGTTPTETIPSIAIEVAGNASELAARFLSNDPPIVGRIVNDCLTIEIRTLTQEDRHSVAKSIRR
jgi:seryl-tRNA(Sec) selenium transferase